MENTTLVMLYLFIFICFGLSVVHQIGLHIYVFLLSYLYVSPSQFTKSCCAVSPSSGT